MRTCFSVAVCFHYLEDAYGRNGPVSELLSSVSVETCSAPSSIATPVRSAFFFTLHHAALRSDVDARCARNGHRLFDQSGLAVAGSSVL